MYSTTPLALALTAFSFLLSSGCDEAQLCDEAQHADPTAAYLELGQGVEAHELIEDGDTLEVYLGSQNLVMFALTLRLEGIEVPENPLNYTDDLAPEVDVGIEIPGYSDDNGYFCYVDSFPLALHTEEGPTGEPSYVAVYVPVIFPDLIDAQEIFGSEVTVKVRVRPASGPSLDVTHSMVVGDEMLSE